MAVELQPKHLHSIPGSSPTVGRPDLVELTHVPVSESEKMNGPFSVFPSLLSSCVCIFHLF